MKALYDTDFAAWALEQAARVRAGKPLDIENVAEELESLGKQERRRLEAHLTVLLTHMLKWDHQALRRSRSWIASIKIQRRQARRVLEENPSLQPQLPEAVADAYAIALIAAADETGMPEANFPAVCPYACEEIFNGEETAL